MGNDKQDRDQDDSQKSQRCVHCGGGPCHHPRRHGLM